MNDNENEWTESPGSDLVTRTEIGDISVLSELTRAEIDIQVATAKNYPRSLQRFQEECYELATMDQETAESMFYGFKRAGKWIEGPSVRFAEIVAYAWGNLRVEGRVIEEGRRTLTAQGVAWDMERNLGSRIEIRRRITTRDGERYSDDMITVTGNAAVSIAIRNAIFDVVPAALAKKAFSGALATAAGSNRPMEQRRDEWVGEFTSRGVEELAIYRMLGIEGLADIGARELRRLIAIRNAVDAGEITLDEAFADPLGEPSSGVVDLNESLRAKREAENSRKSAEEAPEVADQREEAPDATSEEEDDLSAVGKPPTLVQQGTYDEASRYAERLAVVDKLDFNDAEALDLALKDRDTKALKKIRDKLRAQVEPDPSSDLFGDEIES